MLPFILKLPEAIASARTSAELEEVAKLGAGLLQFLPTTDEMCLLTWKIIWVHCHKILWKCCVAVWIKLGKHSSRGNSYAKWKFVAFIEFFSVSHLLVVKICSSSPPHWHTSAEWFSPRGQSPLPGPDQCCSASNIRLVVLTSVSDGKTFVWKCRGVVGAVKMVVTDFGLIRS